MNFFIASGLGFRFVRAAVAYEPPIMSHYETVPAKVFETWLLHCYCYSALFLGTKAYFFLKIFERNEKIITLKSLFLTLIVIDAAITLFEK